MTVSTNAKTFQALIIAAIVLIAFGLPFPVSGAGTGQKKRAVIVLMDKVSWPELAETDPPHLRTLSRRGAVGLLSNRTAMPVTDSGRSYLSIGAGSRADAGPEAGLPLSSARLAKLRRLNRDDSYDLQVGLLGAALRKHELAVAAMGNADTAVPDGRIVPGREVDLIATDGRSPEVAGDTTGRMSDGRATDYTRLFAEFSKQKAANSLLIVETGDTRRADMAGGDKKKAVLAADEFIGRVGRAIDPRRDLLIVLAPTAPLRPDGSQSEQLTPVILAGPGIGHGLATSPSTRRPGLVTTTDIAPTIARFFNIDLGPRSMGRPIRSTPSGTSFASLANLADEYATSEGLAVPIIFAYSAFQGFLLVACSALLAVFGYLGPRGKRVLSTAACMAVLISMSMPLGISVAALIPGALTAAAGYLVLIAVVTVAVAAASWRGPDKAIRPIIAVTGATTAFMVLNVLAGAPGDAKSAFGYGPIVAGRFYGIGNQYLAILAAAVLLLSMLLWERSPHANGDRRLLLGASFAFLVFLVGYGGLGANTGGVIMLTPALTLAYCRTVSGRWSLRQALAAALSTLLALGLVGTIDALRAGESAHLGRLVQRVAPGSWSSLLDVIERKLMFNLANFNYTRASYGVLAVLAVVVFWQIFAYRRDSQWAATRHPGLGVALVAGIVGGVVGTLANDSGIAILALLLGYELMAVLYMEIQDRLNIADRGDDYGAA